MRKMKDDIYENSDIVSKILSQSHKEMGFLLSKIN